MLGTMSELGIRERKKQRTRQALRQAALELFQERGFEATTIADITAAADVAPRTFFSYFQTKEDVVLDEGLQRFDQLQQTLRQRPHGEPLLAAFRRAALEVAAEMRLDLPALMDHAFDLLESGLAGFAARPRPRPGQ